METTRKKRPAHRGQSAGSRKRPAGKQHEEKVTSGARRRSAPRERSRTASPAPGKPERRAPFRSSQPKARPRKNIAAHTKRQAAAPAPTPEVVYTPPKPFNRGRFVLHLATVVAVVLALSFGISIFFKVENITVSGAEKYDAWTVKEASGIEIGDNLLSFGEAKAAGKIKTALPYVERVRIGIKLPDTVNIEIKELDVVYSIRDHGGQWWMITSDGRVVDNVDSATAGDSTTIEGVELDSPVVGQKAVAFEEPVPTADPTADPTDPTAATFVPVISRGSDRLAAALSILQYLEECGIIGEAAYVDVSNLSDLKLKYGQRFDVKLGDTTELLYKIKYMNAVINGTDEANTLKEYDSGTLDVSFTIKKDQAIYQSSQE